MGSSGTHSFTDYSGTKKGGDGMSDGGQGGSGNGGTDTCKIAFSVDLEDVEQCDYFLAHGKVPHIGAKLRVALKKRLVAETIAGSEIVGNLPTNYNYLAACLKAGHSYDGLITFSKDPPPLGLVSADFQPV